MSYQVQVPDETLPMWDLRFGCAMSLDRAPQRLAECEKSGVRVGRRFPGGR